MGRPTSGAALPLLSTLWLADLCIGTAAPGLKAAAGGCGAAAGSASKAACGAKGANGAKGSCGARAANGAASGGEAGMMEAGMVVSGEQSLGGSCVEAGPHNPRFEMSDMEWDLCPNSLGRALRSFWRRYQARGGRLTRTP